VGSRELATSRLGVKVAKKRSSNAQTEREGVLAVAAACNRSGLIWRDILQEDVGIDGTVELVVRGFPTGKLAGIQVKSGKSYFRSETRESFKCYPSASDLDYWRRLTLPVFLIVYDPASANLFWLDVQRHMENRPEDPLGSPYLLFSKANTIDSQFISYLENHFDLTIYSPEQFAQVREALGHLVYEDTQLAGSARVTSLDLFVNGLWGLCSKLQFHLSLLTEAIRERLVERSTPSLITYDLSRTKLFPFLNGYFAALGQHHLARIDYEDLNYTLYSKLEWPAFVVPLTINGRRFVEYLRESLASQRDISDRQYFNLRLHPHAQIEVYASYSAGPVPQFGPYTDVITVQFNKYLDYYYVVHLARPAARGKPSLRVGQLMFYYELTEYLGHVFAKTPKDNVICRVQDMAISPLICWIERFLDFQVGMYPEDLAVEPTSRKSDFAEELLSILSPASSALTRSDQSIPDLRFLRLTNGEPLIQG
jgi:hypothetical protein